MLVCPTSGLQPTLLQAGLEGIWSPVLTPRIGQCDYACNACGRVCPSQAIPILPLAEKQVQVLGKARIDHQRCLPWALGQPCHICEEVCPVPAKAIVLDQRRLVAGSDETQNYLALPRVIRPSCIGCGLCEKMCPISGEAAIVVERDGGGRGDGRGGGRGDGRGGGRNGTGGGRGSGREGH